MKRVLVSVPKGTWEIVEKKLKGKMGEKDSELIRNIVLAYLSEKGYLKEEEKPAAPAANEKKEEKKES